MNPKISNCKLQFLNILYELINFEMPYSEIKKVINIEAVFPIAKPIMPILGTKISAIIKNVVGSAIASKFK